MTNPKCPVCAHVNIMGAAACAMCDTRFGERADAPGEGEPARGAYSGGFDAAGEGFNSFGEKTRPGALPTDIPSPQFKGVGDVLSPTLEVYRKNFLLVGLLVVLTTLPPALFQYAAVRAFQSDMELGPLGALVGSGAALLSWALSLLGNTLLAGALACAVVEIQRKGAASAGECVGWGLGKMLKVFAVTLVTTLMFYAPGIVLGVLAAILGPLVFILGLLLLLPWVVLMLTFSLAIPAAAIENRGPFDALRRSAELTKGFKGLLFLTYFLWRIVIIVVTLVVGWSFASAGGVEDALANGVEYALAGVVGNTLVVGMLESSMSVLTVYIFLGILTERRQGFAPTNAYAPEHAGR